MFERVADGLWTTQRAQKFWGIETGTRMTIAALDGGGLFVHCPVALDAETKAAVDALGILLAHGAVVDTDGREVMREAYRWL
jgi:hypothetical protein